MVYSIYERLNSNENKEDLNKFVKDINDSVGLNKIIFIQFLTEVELSEIWEFNDQKEENRL